MSFIDAVRRLFGGYTKDENYTTVEVQKGDTMYGIAKEITGDPDRWREMEELNPGLDAHHTIQPGQELRIPNEWVYDE